MRVTFVGERKYQVQHRINIAFSNFRRQSRLFNSLHKCSYKNRHFYFRRRSKVILVFKSEQRDYKCFWLSSNCLPIFSNFLMIKIYYMCNKTVKNNLIRGYILSIFSVIYWQSFFITPSIHCSVIWPQLPRKQVRTRKKVQKPLKSPTSCDNPSIHAHSLQEALLSPSYYFIENSNKLRYLITLSLTEWGETNKEWCIVDNMSLQHPFHPASSVYWPFYLGGLESHLQGYSLIIMVISEFPISLPH